jgi:hypothetical protein
MSIQSTKTTLEVECFQEILQTATRVTEAQKPRLSRGKPFRSDIATGINQSNYTQVTYRYMIVRDRGLRRTEPLPQKSHDRPLPGICRHEFSWPMRAANAHYYQTCLHCGARYQYDWKSMRRVERIYRGEQTSPRAMILQAKKGAPHHAAPQLKLLLESEPVGRVFFQNLADLLSRRRTPPLANTSRPGVFWRDVFISPAVPWRRLLESMLYHTIAVAAVVILSQAPIQRTQQQHRKSPQQWYVVYYTSSPPSPARRDRLRIVAGSRRGQTNPQQAALRVAQERRYKSIRPPDIKLMGAYRQPNITVSHPLLPAMPLSVARRSPLTVPAALTSVVDPPPDSKGSKARWPTLPQISAILAPPSVGQAVSLGRAMSSPYAAVVAPAPIMQGFVHNIDEIDIGPAEIIGPAPRLPTNEQPALWPVAAMTTGVPGASIVPPPPSVPGSETGAHGGASSAFGAGLPGVSLTPSVSAPAKSVTSGPLMAMNTHPTATPPRPLPDNRRGPATEELPVRLIGLALVLPNSAYFSNYEVYIAEKAIAKGETQLIKLVYMSLPYQPRLSEYGLNNSTVYKLRVSRDQSCDETLLQMTWPESEAHSSRQNSAEDPGRSPTARNGVLPCYRTTADDYRKALSRSR